MTMWLHVEVSSDANDFPPKPSIGWTQNINSRLHLSPNLNTNYLFYRILIRLCRTEKPAVYTWNSIKKHFLSTMLKARRFIELD